MKQLETILNKSFAFCGIALGALQEHGSELMCMQIQNMNSFKTSAA